MIHDCGATFRIFEVYCWKCGERVFRETRAPDCLYGFPFTDWLKNFEAKKARLQAASDSWNT